MKKLIHIALVFMYLSELRAQTGTHPAAPVIGTLFNQIQEIPRFRNFTMGESLLIDDSLPGKFSFSVISDGKTSVILYTEFIKQGVVKLHAFADIGNNEPGSKMVLAGCRLNTRPDIYLISLVKPNRGEYFKKILKAWKYDIKKRRFYSFPVKGIDCLNNEDDT